MIKSCRNCLCNYLNSDQRFECRARPPIVTHFPPSTAREKIGGKMQMVEVPAKSVTGYPIVSPGWGCEHDFRPKELAT